MSAYNSLSRSASITGPLSFQQERCWKLPDAAHDIIPPLALRIQGPLSPVHLRTALSELTRRQSVLRTGFHEEHGIAIQKISEEPAIDLEIVDLSHLQEPNRALETARLIQREAGRAFIMSSPPLMRVRLVRLHDDEHILCFLVHHIVSDLWSMKILWKELSILYADAAGTPTAKLEKLPVEYIEYARRQRSGLDGASLQKHLDYLHRWARTVPHFTLPYRQSGEDATRRGEVISIELDRELSTAIRHASGERRLTPFMMLLAVFHIFLRRYTGSDRLLVAAMIANRSSIQVESLMGVFSTSLALKMDMRAQDTSRDIMIQTREVLLDAYANQPLPLWQLAQLGAEDIDSTSLRPRISFTLQTAPLKACSIPGLAVSPFASNGATIFEGRPGAIAAFDQAWEVWEVDGAYRITVIYRPRFTPSTVEHMLGSFMETLKSVVIEESSCLTRM